MLRKRFEFKINKTKSEILDKVNKLLLHADYIKGYVYNKADYDFVIAKFYPYANSFRPVFCGKIFEDGNTVNIIITVRMISFMETILLVLAAFSFLLLLPLFISMNFSRFEFDSFPVLSLLFVLIGFVIFNLSINPQLNSLKAHLNS